MKYMITVVVGNLFFKIFDEHDIAFFILKFCLPDWIVQAGNWGILKLN